MDGGGLSSRTVGGRGLLVASGEKAAASTLAAGFRDEGFQVYLASDGLEALALYAEHVGRIDAVLLDVRMSGLDGPQTLARLRLLNPSVRCCFMSSDIGTNTVKGLTGLGAAAVIMKPFSLPYVARMLVGLATV